MLCCDAREWLDAQRNGKLEPARIRELKKHLAICEGCRAFEHSLEETYSARQTQQSGIVTSVSTDQIMQAIHQRARVSQQLEDIRQQQQTRILRIRPVGTVLAAFTFFALSCIPLFLFAILLVQSDYAVQALPTFSGVIDILVVLAQLLQDGLIFTTHNGWLLIAVSLAVVVMMGMWIHLMRPPREA
ncbi:zf-HC2 domain-containing protein [Ktedonospora formicarum]|uniref:Putative zinc-finger domain-containing protein n=1 Tax=Ktedonospora formicarum TaxID=2778364 RepID=A0A8J3HVV2_9CHLR|nr:zf-HC2 domain-containing protein [Ktedonospora formicarum]GHO44714.1 hypothetical protein KSX_28770 [Ktedonospora formicarum]